MPEENKVKEPNKYKPWSVNIKAMIMEDFQIIIQKGWPINVKLIKDTLSEDTKKHGGTNSRVFY